MLGMVRDDVIDKQCIKSSDIKPIFHYQGGWERLLLV